MANKNKFEDVQKMLEPFEYKLIEPKFEIGRCKAHLSNKISSG
jgi:hypothetical protein